jgi:hypothetical protein
MRRNTQLKKSKKTSPKKDNQSSESDTEKTKSTRRKIEDILDKRNLDKLLEL